ncbi:hypothetical protein [Thermoactinospora rubra]|uniref:hypothetical protein n=1 Tax=Thermoactinospora rubra TaxID=1088767 RepID=UPI000A11761A|nr:hypothetical protein [Thermoactinospora rubra]
MAPTDFVRLFWRHRLLVLVALLLTGLALALVATARPVYYESAGVWYVAPDDDYPRSRLENFSPSLIVMGELSVVTLSGDRGRRLVRDLGGTADYTVELVNHGNLETPYHDQPYVLLTVTSRDPEEVNATMRALVNALQQEVQDRQAAMGARERWHVTTEVLTRTPDPVTLSGSRARALGGVLLAGLVGMWLAVSWAERRRGGGRLVPIQLQDG